MIHIIERLCNAWMRRFRCLHGAKCSPSSNFLDFACTCTVGYTGRLCDEDVDECVMTSPCRNGATCRNTNGSYHCVCAKGYEGRDCIINTDDCASCKYNRLFIVFLLHMHFLSLSFESLNASSTERHMFHPWTAAQIKSNTV